MPIFCIVRWRKNKSKFTYHILVLYYYYYIKGINENVLKCSKDLNSIKGRNFLTFHGGWSGGKTLFTKKRKYALTKNTNAFKTTRQMFNMSRH